MRLKFIFFLLVLQGAAAAVYGQKDAPHPIDAALEKCLKTHRGTMPQARCYNAASEAWRKAVSEDYRKLLEQLSPQLQESLRREQTAWQNYREARENYVMAKYGSRRGTGYISVRIVALAEPFKERALLLESRLED